MQPALNQLRAPQIPERVVSSWFLFFLVLLLLLLSFFYFFFFFFFFISFDLLARRLNLPPLLTEFFETLDAIGRRRRRDFDFGTVFFLVGSINRHCRFPSQRLLFTIGDVPQFPWFNVF